MLREESPGKVSMALFYHINRSAYVNGYMKINTEQYDLDRRENPLDFSLGLSRPSESCPRDGVVVTYAHAEHRWR